MNTGPSFSLAGGGADPLETARPPLSSALAGALWRGPFHDWGKSLAAAIIAHLAALACLFTLAGVGPPPPPRLESVVVVRLASLIPTPPTVEPSLETPALSPAPAEPAPRPAKKTPPRPAPLATKPPAKRLTKPLTHKTPPLVAYAPADPVPAVAATSPPEPAAGGHAATRPDARAVASATMTATIQPKPINQPRPVYPAAAQRRGLEGKVILQVTVGADGAVRAVAISHSSSHSSLDEAAIASVWDWRFQPGQIGGEVREMTISLPVDFRLR